MGRTKKPKSTGRWITGREAHGNDSIMLVELLGSSLSCTRVDLALHSDTDWIPEWLTGAHARVTSK